MVKLHRHAKQRCKERGATRDEVIHTVLNGMPKPAKFGRMMFSLSFPFGKTWLDKSYARKRLDVIARRQPSGDWLVLTVIVKFY